MPVLSAVSTVIVPLLVRLDDLDPTPRPADVKAGYPALFLFLTLFAVVGLLGWSLTRHLRKVESNRRAGFFGDQPEAEPGPDTADGASGRDATGGPGDPVSPRGPGSTPSA